MSDAPSKRGWQVRNGKMLWDCRAARLEFVNQLGTPTSEQELHISQSRDQDRITIDCSHTLWITKLKKNPAFKVDVLSIDRTGRIVRAAGSLPGGFVSMRTRRKGWSK